MSSESKLISVDKIEPNAWNPQEMTDAQFNELVNEMREDDFDDPILVVEHPDTKKASDGMFMIIDGEHRWQAARVLGISEVPCIVKGKWVDEKTQKIKTVRRNMLRGDVNKTKFTKLVHSLNDVGIPMKEMPSVLGFANETEFRNRFVAEEREKEEKAVKRAAKSAREDEKRESEVINNLSFILNEILAEYGETVPQGFIFFCHKNKMHLFVQMDEKLEKLIENMIKYLRSTGKNVDAFLRRAINSEFEVIEKQEGVDPRKLRDIKEDANISDFDEEDDESLEDAESSEDDDLDDSEISENEEDADL